MISFRITMVVITSVIACAAGFAGCQAGQTTEPAQTTDSDESKGFYFNGDDRVAVTIADDRVGVLARERVSRRQLDPALKPLGLRIVEEHDDFIFILRTERPQSQVELLRLAAQLRTERLVIDAGLVVTPDGSRTPMIMNDEVIVGFRANVTGRRSKNLHSELSTRVVGEIPFGDREFIVTVTDQKRADEPALTALALSRRYQASRDVVYSHPNFIIPIVYRQTVPNDPLFNLQWHLENTGQGGGAVDADIDAPRAWDMTMGAIGTVIAVVDGGFDSAHPDLAPNLWTNPGEIAGNNSDDDGNGFTDDVNGWNFFSGTSNLAGGSHGTSVAGCAAARGNNNLGVAGSGPRCGLMLLRNGGTTANRAAVFNYARVQGAAVITNSWGFSVGTAIPVALRNAINNAANNGRGGLGCVITWAMNNGNFDDCAGPTPDLSANPNVIAVSAVSNQDRKVTESAWGNCMDVLGPTHRGYGGVAYTGTRNVTTTDVTGAAGYNNASPSSAPCPAAENTPPPANARDYTQCFGGTSAATPIVAGVAGMLLTLDPTLTRQEVQQTLQDTCDKVEDSNGVYALETGYSTPAGGVATHGYGRVNAFEAVRTIAPVASGGRGGVDIFIRDNRLDWGNTEQLSNLTFEPVRGFIDHWHSVDIKVDAPPLQPAPSNSLQFDAIAHENPRAETTNRVYVRVRNRGPLTASSVRVKLHWTFAGTALPALPADFWTAFPGDSTNTSVWHPLGVQTIANLDYCGATVAGSTGDAAAIVQFDWSAPPLDPSAPAMRHHCLFAVIDAADDQVSSVATSSLVPDFITPRDNNVTHRNVQLQDPGEDRFEVAFYVRNPLRELIRTRLRLPVVPERWIVRTEGVPLDKEFRMEPGEEILVTARIEIRGNVRRADLSFVQERLGRNETIMGGFTVTVADPRDERRPRRPAVVSVPDRTVYPRR